MKNVLFTTTALVAFASVASAASHDSMEMSGTSVSFSGEVTAGYNDKKEGGIFTEANLDFDASVDLGDNVTVTLSGTLIEYTEAGFKDGFMPTVEVAYTGGAFNASLKVGDLDDEGASEHWYADRDGMFIDVENHDDDSDPDVRALVEFGDFGIAVGCDSVKDNSCNTGYNVGLGATFGTFKLGVGYDSGSGSQNQVTAVSADTTLGKLALGLSYASGSRTDTFKTGVDGNDADANVGSTDTPITVTENSIGLELGYEISSSLSVDAYYANNSVTGDSYGVSGTYTSGAFEVSAYFDHEVLYAMTSVGVDADGDGYYTGGLSAALSRVDSYGIDLAYTLNEQLTANAGYKNGVGSTGGRDIIGSYYYVGIDYAVNDNITATVSFANAHELSGPEYKEGISAFITATF